MRWKEGAILSSEGRNLRGMDRGKSHGVWEGGRVRGKSHGGRMAG